MAKTDMTDMITMTIGQMVEYQAKMHPDNDGLVAPLIGVRYSYRQFNEECDKIAKAFLAIGIKRGDHIAIWSTNYPQWVITQVAASKIGAVLVTVNTAYKRFELEYLLRQSDSDVYKRQILWNASPERAPACNSRGKFAARSRNMSRSIKRQPGRF